jgi:chromosome segregation ATPase
MKSSLPVPPGAAGQHDDAGPAAAGACRYPGCGHPARARAGDGPGAPPRYCGRTVAEDRGEHGTAEVTHTALTAFRRRQELAGTDPGSDHGRPLTTAITRAAAIRDDALAAITRLSAQLDGTLGQLGAVAAQLAAASPEAAEAQAEAVRAETAAGLEAARAELAGQAARAHAAEAETAEARAAAAQAITAMQAAQAARADAEARAAAAQTAQAEALRQAAQAHADAEAAVTAAGQAAREQVSQARAEAGAAITAARAERDTALAAATAADARHQDARDQLAQLRDDHQRHAAALAAAHQAQLGALDETITGLRARLQRAEADAGPAERQHLTARPHETATRPAGARKAATP